ncbi:hypothetical protein QYF36_024348 [Acer negundo]|nr:hypothetical protein QYF36_024348 [Acer negundo]
MDSANFSSPNETSFLAASSERQDLNDCVVIKYKRKTKKYRSVKEMYNGRENNTIQPPLYDLFGYIPKRPRTSRGEEKAVPDLLDSIQRHGVNFQQRRSRYHGGVVIMRIGKSGKWKPWMGLTGNHDDNGKGKSLKGPAQNEDKGKKIAFAMTDDGVTRKSSLKELTVYEEQVQQNPDRRIISLGNIGRQPADYVTPISSKWVNFQLWEVAKQSSIFRFNPSSSSAFHCYISKASINGPNSILGGFSRMDYGGFLRCYNAADPDDEWLIAQDGSEWKLPKWLKYCKISYYLPPYQVNFIKQQELRSAFGHGFRHSISSAFKPCVKRN